MVYFIIFSLFQFDGPKVTKSTGSPDWLKFTQISNHVLCLQDTVKHRKVGGTSVRKDTFIIVSFRWSSKKVSKKIYTFSSEFIGQIRKRGEKREMYYDGRKDGKK